MRFVALLLIPSLLMFSLPSSAKEEAKVSGTAKVTAYYNLSPSLVVNVSGRARYMRCDVQLMTRDKDKLAVINLHAPALRHELLMLFSDQQGQDVRDTRGKEKLREMALRAVRGVMKRLVGDELIDDLFFTSYFVE